MAGLSPDRENQNFTRFRMPLVVQRLDGKLRENNTTIFPPPIKQMRETQGQTEHISKRELIAPFLFNDPGRLLRNSRKILCTPLKPVEPLLSLDARKDCDLAGDFSRSQSLLFIDIIEKFLWHARCNPPQPMMSQQLGA